jgi:hypothetical protein
MAKIVDINKFDTKQKDKDFIVHLIAEIADYAREQEYNVDETIDTVVDWLVALRKLATFNGLKEDDNSNNDECDANCDCCPYNQKCPDAVQGGH